MSWFSWKKSPAKAELQALKRLRLGGATYTIKRLNPLLDFPAEKMPTVFSAYQSARKTAAGASNISPAKMLEEMMLIVSAGLVEPKLVPAGKGDARGREEGITVEDLFRVPEHGTALYLAIMDHALNKFSGIRKVFFSLRIRQLHSIGSQVAMDAAQAA